MTTKDKLSVTLLFICFVFFPQVFAVDGWLVDYGLYEQNMTITGVVMMGDSALEQTQGIVLAAFNTQGQCVGKANGRYYKSVEKYRIPLMVYGNTEGEKLSLKVFLNEQNIIMGISDTITFKANGSIGNYQFPLHLKINDFTIDVKKIEQEILSFSVYPNPAENNIHVKVSDAYINGNFTLFDELGREFSRVQLTSKNTVVEIDHLSPGVYIGRIEKGTHWESRKFIKKE